MTKAKQIVIIGNGVWFDGFRVAELTAKPESHVASEKFRQMLDGRFGAECADCAAELICPFCEDPCAPRCDDPCDDPRCEACNKRLICPVCDE